jgi:hypothetical protein
MRRWSFMLLPAACLALPVAADAQEWRLSTQVGRLSWEGSAPGGVDQSSFAIGLSRFGHNDWFTLSAGTPFEDGSVWAALGSGKRFAMDRPVGLGLDLSSHFFMHRVSVQTTEQRSGPLPPIGGEQTITTSAHDYLGGAAGQTMGVAFARHRSTRLELRGGLAVTATYIADQLDEAYTPVIDGRLLTQAGPVQLGPEAQHWHERGTYAGATAVLGIGSTMAWASAGKWTHVGPTDLSWSAGAALSLTNGLRLDANVRENGFDPLYAQATGRTMALGASVRLGSRSRFAPPVPAEYAHGRAVIRLRAKDVRGTPSIAGDFSGWKRVPMVASGQDWAVSLPLEPGVYHYAFVTEDGEWFVPENTPGRRDDGMGGWVAVLVVGR